MGPGLVLSMSEPLWDEFSSWAAVNGINEVSARRYYREAILADRWLCEARDINLLWADLEDIEVYCKYRRAQNGQSHPERRISVFLEWLSWGA